MDIQNKAIASYFSKSPSMCQSLLSKDIYEESKVNIPMGEKIEVKQDIVSPKQEQMAANNDNSLSVMKFPSIVKSTLKEKGEASNVIEISDNIEEDYDSELFVPKADFLTNINKNMQINDTKVLVQSSSPPAAIEMNEAQSSSNVSSFANEIKPDNNGLVFAPSVTKEMNDSDDEKDEYKNGRLHDQKSRAKYGIRPLNVAKINNKK